MSLMLTLRRALVVSLTLLTVSVFVGATPASAVEGTAALKGGAAVQARGAALVVQVVVTCPGGSDAQLFARATQRRADGTLARGTGFQERVVCTGAPQTQRMTVGAADSVGTGKPFVVGPAFLSVDINFCRGSCGVTRIRRTVQATAVTVDAARFTSSAITVSLPATAELEAAGAGVTMRIPYRCASGTGGFFIASLLQRTSDSGVTGGSDSGTVTCTGLGRTGVLAFHAEAAAWTAGSGFVSINGAVCNDAEECQPVYVHRTLTIA